MREVGGVSGGGEWSEWKYSTHWCGGNTPRTVHTGVVGTLLVQYTLVWWGHSSYSTLCEHSVLYLVICLHIFLSPYRILPTFPVLANNIFHFYRTDQI